MYAVVERGSKKIVKRGFARRQDAKAAGENLSGGMDVHAVMLEIEADRHARPMAPWRPRTY